jgi:DNA polymerase I-like protein with 3'-5' exonuclease and polymerase domains
LKNRSLNSPVQNFEIVLIVKTINGLTKFIKENNLKSRVWATIHDSIILYIHKDEVEIITKKAIEIFEEDIPENMGIPQELEGTIADYYNKGEAWGDGTDALEFIEQIKVTK